MTRALAVSIALHCCLFIVLALAPNAPVRRLIPEEKIIPVNVINLPPLQMPTEAPPETAPKETSAEPAPPPAEPAKSPPVPKNQAPRAAARNIIRTITPREIVVPDLVAKMEPSPIVDTSLKDKIKARLKTPTPQPPPPPATSAPRSVAPPSAEARRSAQTPSPVAEPPRPSQTPPAGQPPPSGALSARYPAPTVGFEGPLFPHAWYVAIVQGQIYENWSPPQRLLVLKPGATATIYFTIKRDGTIKDVAIRESSGYTLLDRSALEAVRGLTGLPPLPTDFKEEELRVVVHFQPVLG